MGSVQAATPHSRLGSPRASPEDSPGLVLWVSALPGVALGAGRASLQLLFIAWWPEAQPVGPSTLVCGQEKRTLHPGKGSGQGSRGRDRTRRKNKMGVKEVTVIECGGRGRMWTWLGTPRREGTEMKRQDSLPGPGRNSSSLARSLFSDPQGSASSVWLWGADRRGGAERGGGVSKG